MVTLFNLLAIGSILAGMVLAFLHLVRGKRILPFAHSSHARSFGWGLVLPFFMLLAFVTRGEPMANTSLWFAGFSVIIVAVWFYLTSEYWGSMRHWGAPYWNAMLSAQFGAFVVIAFTSLGLLMMEGSEREAYLKKYEPARYAALQAKKAEVRKKAEQEDAAWEASQRQKEAAQERQEWEEKYKKACNTPEAFLGMAEDITRERLKSPTSARFASWRDPAVKYSGSTDPETKECSWVVKSFVDSQNSFGAMIRTGFMAEIKLKRDQQMTMMLTDYMAFPNQ